MGTYPCLISVRALPPLRRGYYSVADPSTNGNLPIIWNCHSRRYLVFELTNKQIGEKKGH
jgi:hypothetical protein